MSFWNSVKRKARKEHSCIYCGKTIVQNEEYSRESGKFEGEFQDYCLCLRCKWVVQNIDEGEYLGEFLDTLFENDILSCPSCGSRNLSEYELSGDNMLCDCECDDCDEKWVADLSIDGLKEIIRATT